MIQKRYSTQDDCRFAISPEGAVSPALPGAGQPRDGNYLKSSDLALLAPNHLRAQNAIRKRSWPYPGLTALWSGRNGGLHCFRCSAGHARCSPSQIMARRTVTAVDARPGPSSFAPIFGPSPQYRMLGAPSIFRSWVEPRDVQISARPVDLVGKTEFSSEAGSARLARPKRHPPRGPSPTWGPSFRSYARRGPPSYSFL